jgi:hypothetical protein
MDRHLEVGEIAAYVDGGIVGPARAEIETHLATCAQCRAEVAEVGGVIRSMPGARRSPFWIPAAAAAAIVLVWAGSGVLREPPPAVHRDTAVTMTPAPRLVAPVGTVDSLSTVVWSSVPTADRYRIRLFDPMGTVLWERETSDTSAVVPSTLSLRRGTPYYWKVESHAGFDRWAESELVEFVPRYQEGG